MIIVIPLHWIFPVNTVALKSYEKIFIAFIMELVTTVIKSFYTFLAIHGVSQRQGFIEVPYCDQMCFIPI